jgi:hypothetical protein
VICFQYVKDRLLHNPFTSCSVVMLPGESNPCHLQFINYYL